MVGFCRGVKASLRQVLEKQGHCQTLCIHRNGFCSRGSDCPDCQVADKDVVEQALRVWRFAPV